MPVAFSHFFHCCASCPVLSSQSLFSDLPDLTSPLTFCWAASVNQAFLKTDEDTALGGKKNKKTNPTKKPNENRPIHLFNKAPPSSLCTQSSLFLAHKTCKIKHISEAQTLPAAWASTGHCLIRNVRCILIKTVGKRHRKQLTAPHFIGNTLNF